MSYGKECYERFLYRKCQGEDKPRLPSVILSAAKDLRPAPREILRCAQDDSGAEVNGYGACPCPGNLNRQFFYLYKELRHQL